MTWSNDIFIDKTYRVIYNNVPDWSALKNSELYRLKKSLALLAKRLNNL